MQYTKEDKINDIRSNIIVQLLKLYRKFQEQGRDVELQYERYRLYFKDEKLWMTGCADEISVEKYDFQSVNLGREITSYSHLPYHWLKSLEG